MLLRLTRAGVLHRVRHGVYALIGTPVDDVQRIRAEWLVLVAAAEPAPSWRPETVLAVVGYEAAALLHNIGALPVRTVTFIVRRRRQSERPGVAFRRASLAREDICEIDGLPVTSPRRTLHDLWHARVSPEDITNLFLDAEAQGLLQAKDLAELIGVRVDDVL